MIPDQAIAAGLAAWGQYAVGVSPKRQMANILEAAAPYMLSLSAAEIEAVGDMVKAAKAEGWEEGCRKGLGTNPGWEDETLARNPYKSSEPRETVIRDSAGHFLDRWIETNEDL